ncbi:hypothetical protein [Inovirus D_HF32_91]|uniref:Uncharacterized protein n=2 Tax=Haemophilus parahaemolyticus TaxID=735 RepID=A0AAE6JP01_HAEPH|nr:hypothetical protein [Haemophilus parahaemolyticus]WMC01150.1 hypothetical protein [Inovirus D_HF32_91]EIJ73151.1 hypothetical protein HMPREF1050_0270 [Haemophilus parahaemolyticus HK385]OOR97658.1 hypothetical protein B0185_02320 [Haemophilus parahaemolyticus]QEN10040.1 hypothetical protein E5Q53_00405 [Haemophilus parahaemolyticus]QRP13027.1 hypothetical protein I6J29_02395 [Haemophilus parahaemolyticus]
MDNQEYLKIAVTAIRSRFQMLDLMLSNELTQPSKEGLQSVVNLTEMDLNVIKSIIENKE